MDEKQERLDAAVSALSVLGLRAVLKMLPLFGAKTEMAASGLRNSLSDQGPKPIGEQR